MGMTGGEKKMRVTMKRENKPENFGMNVNAAGGHA